MSSTVAASVYRPKKIPRVIRRQMPVVRLAGWIVFVGLIAVGVTWRKVTCERFTLEIANQRSSIESLDKEIQHLKGLVKIEASYPKVSDWARQTYGWRPIRDRVKPLVLDQHEMTPTAMHQAKVLEVTHE